MSGQVVTATDREKFMENQYAKANFLLVCLFGFCMKNEPRETRFVYTLNLKGDPELETTLFVLVFPNQKSGVWNRGNRGFGNEI